MIVFIDQILLALSSELIFLCLKFISTSEKDCGIRIEQNLTELILSQSMTRRDLLNHDAFCVLGMSQLGCQTSGLNMAYSISWAIWDSCNAAASAYVFVVDMK